MKQGGSAYAGGCALHTQRARPDCSDTLCDRQPCGSVYATAARIAHPCKEHLDGSLVPSVVAPEHGNVATLDVIRHVSAPHEHHRGACLTAMRHRTSRNHPMLAVVRLAVGTASRTSEGSAATVWRGADDRYVTAAHPPNATALHSRIRR